MGQDVPQNVRLPETPQITPTEAKAMARAVVKLFEHWKVSDDVARDILGGLPPQTYARWKVGDSGSIDENLATRLSLLMGIHARLRSLFEYPEQGYAWIGRANDAFGGLSPEEIMVEGDIRSLARVRSYLEAKHSGW